MTSGQETEQVCSQQKSKGGHKKKMKKDLWGSILYKQANDKVPKMLSQQVSQSWGRR